MKIIDIQKNTFKALKSIDYIKNNKVAVYVNLPVNPEFFFVKISNIKREKTEIITYDKFTILIEIIDNLSSNKRICEIIEGINDDFVSLFEIENLNFASITSSEVNDNFNNKIWSAKIFVEIVCFN